MKYGIYELNGQNPDEPVDTVVGTTEHEAREAASRRARQLVQDGEIRRPIHIGPVPERASGMVRGRVLFGALALSVLVIATLAAWML